MGVDTIINHNGSIIGKQKIWMILGIVGFRKNP